MLLQEIRQTLFNSNINSFTNFIRLASKKTGTSTRNPKSHGRPKHRGWRVQDGTKVQAGTILALQRTLRFHPGLNVSFLMYFTAPIITLFCIFLSNIL